MKPPYDCMKMRDLSAKAQRYLWMLWKKCTLLWFDISDFFVFLPPHKKEDFNTMELVHKNLVLPNNGKKLLLHTCCAPCSGSIILSIQGSGIDFTIFIYNPNIHAVYLLLMQNTTPTIGMLVPKVWSLSLSAAAAVQCALICVWSALPYMLTKMALIPLLPR